MPETSKGKRRTPDVEQEAKHVLVCYGEATESTAYIVKLSAFSNPVRYFLTNKSPSIAGFAAALENEGELYDNFCSLYEDDESFRRLFSSYEENDDDEADEEQVNQACEEFLEQLSDDFEAVRSYKRAVQTLLKRNSDGLDRFKIRHTIELFRE